MPSMKSPVVGIGPKTCEPGGERGVFLPVSLDIEQNWDKPVQFVVYLLGLFYCFLGVSVVCDVFMSAIECITSKKKRVLISGEGDTAKYVTVKTWNDTVANLTLMALGSSAPEILLSVIELIKNEFLSGPLGPSTIVGSAAFNLLCITGVCVIAIPNGEIRMIKDVNVFLVTAVVSIFAYVWLVLILAVISPDVIDIFEGVLTFACFPVLVGLAYGADVGWFSAPHEPVKSIDEMTKDEIAARMRQIRAMNPQETLNDEEVLKRLNVELGARTSRAKMRVAATRLLVGGRRVDQTLTKGVTQTSTDTLEDGYVRDPEDEGVNVIEFSSTQFAVLENAGTVFLQIQRKGDLTKQVAIHYKSVDGTGKAGVDYEKVEGVVTFEVGRKDADIEVEIKPNSKSVGEHKCFSIDLFKFGESAVEGNAKAPAVRLGKRSNCEVVIIDVDGPGELHFEKEMLTVREDAKTITTVPVLVKRVLGWGNEVTCKYRTEDGCAIAGADYTQIEGCLTFKKGQTSAELEIDIMPQGRYERTEYFRLVLFEPTGGVTFPGTTDGGSESNILTIEIAADESHKRSLDNIMAMMNWDKAQIGSANCVEQFKAACYVNGGWEEQKKARVLDWILHVIAFPWKFICAFIPPTDFVDGWACFIVCLGVIGVVTAVIGDFAMLLGCSLRIPDEITAITFVALGTSLPDTLASKTAAVQDDSADASVGNVTGSNSVNVFLGLGLPWSIGAVYWHVKDSASDKYLQQNAAILKRLGDDLKFIVPSEGLDLCVTTFAACAITCLFSLGLRRKLVGGELGGPAWSKWASGLFFFFLWIVYVVISCYLILSRD